MMASRELPTTGRPLSVNSIGVVGAACAVAERFIGFLSSSRDLAREIFDHGEHGIGRGLSEAADRRVDHGLRQLLQQGLIPRSLLDELQSLRGAHPAGGALPARLF